MEPTLQCKKDWSWGTVGCGPPDHLHLQKNRDRRRVNCETAMLPRDSD